MRLYSFGNYYLSQIQQGIQMAHCVSNLFNEYMPYSGSSHYQQEGNLLMSWASEHKTIICLNGGNALDLRQIYDRLKYLGTKLQLPYTFFEEAVQSLNKCITCVSIIVPEEIYSYDPDPVFGSGTKLNPIELELFELIKSKRLA